MNKTVIYAVILSVVSLGAGVALGMTVSQRCAIERRQHFFSGLRERGGDRAKGFQQHKQRLLANLAEKLNLTAEQKEKVKAILKSSREEMTSVRKDTMAKVQVLRDSTNAKIQEVLTPEQKEKFKKITNGYKQRHGAGKWFRGGPGGPQPLK